MPESQQPAMVTGAAVEVEALRQGFNRGFADYRYNMQMDPSGMLGHLHRSNIDLEDCAVLVAEEEGRMQGVGAALLAVRGDEGWCGGLSIDPAYRGGGWGRRLMEHLKRRAVERGCSPHPAGSAGHQRPRPLGVSPGRLQTLARTAAVGAGPPPGPPSRFPTNAWKRPTQPGFCANSTTGTSCLRSGSAAPAVCSTTWSSMAVSASPSRPRTARRSPMCWFLRPRRPAFRPMVSLQTRLQNP